MRQPLAPALIAIAALALGACRTAPVVAPPAPVANVAIAADDTLNATLWFQTSAERDQVYRQVYRAALSQLDAALRDPAWDALPRGERSNDPRGLAPAIIMDIDETVLDNAPYQARRVRDGQEYGDASWAAWVEQPLAGRPGAKALPGAADFVRAAAARGITTFFISNRNASTAEATLQALRAAGFPAAAEQFLGRGTAVAGCTQEGLSDKRCRRWQVAQRHRVLMLFGDQLSDFVSASGTPAERRVLAEAYADWFGQRWWMLPNPMYGAWESAAWGERRGLSREVRRQAKVEALDTAD